MLSGPLQCQRCGATELPINFGKRFWRTPQSCDPAWKNELCSAIGDGRMVERQNLEGLLMFRCKLRKVCEKLAWRVPKSDLERLLPRKEVAWEEVLVFQIALGLPWKLKRVSACLRVCVCVCVCSYILGGKNHRVLIFMYTLPDVCQWKWRCLVRNQVTHALTCPSLWKKYGIQISRWRNMYK